MSKVVNLLKRPIRRIGFDFVRYPQYDTLAYHLRLVFDRLSINCVLDIGAHVGEYGIFLRNSVAYDGQIISFEPIDSKFSRLKSICNSDNRWTAYRVALGSKTQQASINRTSGTFSSFLSPNEFGRRRFGKAVTFEGVETVKITRLDEIFLEITSLITNPRVFLKTDTQGYDLEVVKGAESCLHHILALQTEISVKPIYQNSPHYFEQLEHLEKNGFAITGIFPVSRDDSMRMIEADCVMINEGMGITTLT